MGANRYTAQTDLDQVIYVLSHDLQASPRALRQYLMLFKSECGSDFPGDSERYVQRMDGVLDRMDRQIEALLALSRSKKPKGPIENHDIAELLTPILEERGIQSTIAKSLPAVHCDRPRLIYLLTELADNVIHHGGSNATVNVNHDGDWFLFEDTGQGVPERIRNEVFVVFRPVAHSKSERLGMGLCRCSSILESLGGSIEMECPDNGGTIIRFRL